MKKTMSISELRKRTFKWDGYLSNIWWYRLRRNLAIYFAKLLLYTPITANFLTVFMLVSWIIAAAFISYKFFIIGFLFMMFGDFLDYVDGVVARGKKQQSPVLASYLDAMYHQLSPAFVLLGLGFAFYFSTFNVLYLFLGISGCIAQIITNYMFVFRNFTFLNFDYEMKKKVKDVSYVSIPFSDQSLSKTMRFFYALSIKPMKWFQILYLVLYLVGYLNIMLLFFGSFLSLRMLALYVFIYRSMKEKDVQLLKFRKKNKK